jgi:hypothetical protein
VIREFSILAAFLFCFAVLCIAGIIELGMAKIVMESDRLIIIDGFRKNVIEISGIKSVKIEDYELLIYMKDGKIHKMPYWFAGRRGLYQILRSKLKYN